MKKIIFLLFFLINTNILVFAAEKNSIGLSLVDMQSASCSDIRRDINKKKKEYKLEMLNAQSILFKRVLGLIDNIQKGKIEQEVIDWFGEPMWNVDAFIVDLLTPAGSNFLKQFGYPAPNDSQKVFGYVFYHADYVSTVHGFISVSSRLLVLITINKETKLVEEFCKLRKDCELEDVWKEIIGKEGSFFPQLSK